MINKVELKIGMKADNIKDNLKKRKRFQGVSLFVNRRKSSTLLTHFCKNK